MESYFNRGLLWISITKKSNSLLRIKVRRAMGIKAADQSNTLADGKVTAQLLSGQHCTTLFTVLSKSVEQHYQNSTAMLKFNTVFYLNAPPEDLRRKRLYFSVHASRDNNAGWDEMVGCFSLSFASLIDLSDHNTKLVNGWYFLLPSDVGRTQHVSAVGGNPRDLLQQVRCLTLDADDDADDEWNPSYPVVPNSDGSVCRGHVIQGQLETDIDAAFCCIPKEKVFPETKERRLEDSLHNVQCQLSALMEECEISDKVHMPKHSTAIRSYADQSDSTNSTQSTESQRVDLHLFETPSRFGNTSVKLRGKRKIKRDSLQILRRQLSFRSSSGYSSEHPSRDSTDSLETSVDSSVMGVNNSHKDLALKSSVSCCSKGVLFGVLKVRGRKMKSLKNARMQQTSEESFDIASLSSISSNSVIATSLNESAFIARDEQLYSIDVDQSAPRRTDKFQRYLKTEPEFKNHVTVLAVQKRIIGFHRSSDRRKDLGFTVSDKHELEAASAFVWAGYSRDHHNHRPTNLDSDTSIFKFQAPGTRRNHNDSSCSDVSSRCRSNSSSSELSSSNELNMSHPPKPLDLSCQLSFDKLHELNLSSRVPPGHTSVASNNLKNEIYSYLRQIRNTPHSTIEDSSIKKNTANRLNTNNIRNASFQHNIDYNSFANGRIRSSSFIDDASSSSSRSLFSSDSCSNCCSESSCSSCSRNNSFGSWDSGSTKVMGPRVVISRVAPGTAADDWGLLPGDGIVAVNHYDVRCASSLQIIRMLNDTDGEVVLEVERTGNVTWVH